MNDYGLASRWLHRFALGPAAIREMAFDLDQSAGQIHAPLDTAIAEGRGRHVFVSGLARAGTSVLFRTFYATGAFETLSYRDMPFVLAPRLWRKITHSHRLDAVEQERAHRDGLMMSFDSPEAFEEVFWLTFAGQDYLRPDRLLRHNADPDVIGRFRRYVAAIVARAGARGSQRYLSKNNNNLLRLGAVRSAFPGAAIVVPFRRPADHARSLFRQHQNFRAQQAEDTFARDYMRWLGHFEFGLDQRPFVLGETDALPPGHPDEPQYWLAYWTETYRAVLDQADAATLFLDYDAICERPVEVLLSLERTLDLPGTADRLAGNIRASTRYEFPATTDRGLIEAADDVHAALRQRSLR